VIKFYFLYYFLHLYRSLLILAITNDSKISPYNFLKIGIKKSPEELKKLIAKRLKKRIKIGMIKEVKNLRNPPTGGGLSWQRLDDLGLEYRYVSRFLRQRAQIYADLTLTNAEKKKMVEKIKKEMVDLILKESWQYAKRQMTWFKKNGQIRWIKNEKEAYKIIKRFLLN